MGRIFQEIEVADFARSGGLDLAYNAREMGLWGFGFPASGG
jgi:hypothetical protein